MTVEELIALRDKKLIWGLCENYLHGRLWQLESYYFWMKANVKKIYYFREFKRERSSEVCFVWG